ncbi:ATP-binding protein [Lyngbya aestuarii]|uniref:ATP-binding protein n=1 Tax=Lyngbya aestuarii TaxID=118322 RepID=UPI00403E32F0
MKSADQQPLKWTHLKVLLVEDNLSEAELIQELLSENNAIKIDLIHAQRLEQARELLQQENFDVILLDLSLPDSQGLDTVANIQECGLNLPIVVLTARNDQELAIQLIQVGAQDYLVKGNVSSELLLRSLRYAVERQLAQEAVRLNEERYRFVVNSVQEVIFQIDITGNWIFLNPAWTEITGFSVSQSLGTPFLNYIHPEERHISFRNFNALIKEKKDYFRSEIRYFTSSGGFCWMEVHQRLTFTLDGTVSGITGTLNDITEQKLAQEALCHSELREREKAQQLEIALHKLQNTQAQLVQNEKMVSLGQLIAGVAHEINNPVCFIYGNIAFASEYTSNLLHLIGLYQEQYPTPSTKIQKEVEALDLDFLKEDFPRLLNSMEEGANRIQEIVRSLRHFSHSDQAKMKKVDLWSGINSTLLILQHRLKKQPTRPEIQVIKDYEDLPEVECYPGQLNQVFMNILSNAIDALEKMIEEDSSLAPEIRIRTQFNAHDKQVAICITDNGIGMMPKEQQRVFDPFFTTKPVGTGLGLSISYSIVVEKHQGQLECYSQLSKGTEFVIKLPLQPGKCGN